MASIDLHIHSLYSDGDTSILDLYHLIKNKKIKTFSITDHDEIEGTKEMLELVKQDNDPNITFIPGVELTAKVSHGRMHLLGYDFNPEDKDLNSVLKEKKESDRYNFLLQIDYLKKDYAIAFPKIDIDNILKRVGNIGRVDIAKLLIKYGYVSNVQMAFDLYLNPIMEKVRTKKKGLSMEECVELILNAKGYVSWAHWNSYATNYQELYDTTKYLVSLGMQCIEKDHINLNLEERLLAQEMINKFNLYASGGTDYHGLTIKPNVMIGTGINNNINIDELSLVDAIKIKKLKK